MYFDDLKDLKYLINRYLQLEQEQHSSIKFYENAILTAQQHHHYQLFLEAQSALAQAQHIYHSIRRSRKELEDTIKYFII